MSVRRIVSMFGVCVAATLTVAVAQPKKAPPKKDAKKGPVAPAKDATPPPAPAGSGSAAAGSGAGSAVQMTEDPPPKDLEGRDENPGNPGGVNVGPTDDATKIVVPLKKKTAGYPTQEALRPINLPANMSEVSIAPHFQAGFGSDAVYKGGDALRARYGVTRQVQIGLTYLFAGAFDDPATMEDSIGVHGGKAVGLDVTVLLQDWIGVRVGVPVYIKPVAYSLTIGAPIKFRFADGKYAIGGLDDLLNIKLKRFAPTFYQEADNAGNAALDSVNGTSSRGELRISAFGVYQRDAKTAIIGRLGFQLEDFVANEADESSNAANKGITYFLRAGANYTPRKYLDVGFSLGFDDLAHYGSFGPSAYLAFRI